MPLFHRPLKPSEYAVGVFTAAYLGASLVRLICSPNAEFAFYLTVTLLLLGAVVALHRKIDLHIGALWGLAVWGLLHMAGGLVYLPVDWPIGGETHVLYNLWLIEDRLKYDQVVHAFGFGLVTWIAWQGLTYAFAQHGVRPRPTLGLMTLCVCVGMGAGALNEVVEFAAFQTLPETNVGEYENTGWDLVSNLVGSLIAATVIYLRRQPEVGK
ncbi:hypothetical protein Pla123a_05120 [Posidoniimonas polymericola]|uniref:Inner membrane protein YjdF n=1 Tax=Posidoniimonas polymericola TaxID=2528002 RepID=A0A5C5ZF29_9BACT|nr:DUF2238 domain-containing protein [Posidoniimonas polymericola]TWT85705.1 hypothetical protein Pla123a_05120 [Posidoniimonas polymericola]